MTTVGVNVSKMNSKNPINIPQYAFKYPCSSRLNLSATKHGIFNSLLPSFRTIDRDTHMNKLPYEHCQTSTWQLQKNKHIEKSTTKVKKKVYKKPH